MIARFLFVLLLAASTGNAQSTIGLIAHYPFDSTLADLTGNTANNGIPSGSPNIQACGPIGNALVLNSDPDQITFLGQVNDEFDTEDFTLGFYFKPKDSGTQYLISKRSDDCDNLDNVFFIRYAPLGDQRGTVNVVMRETADIAISMIHTIDNGACWQHLVLVREKNKVKLYINGEFVQEAGTDERIDIFNAGNLVLGGNECKDRSRERNFNGFIDDMRVYNRALDDDEIEGLYFRPDRIATSDTIVFLGNSVNIQLSKTCANRFLWSPSEDLDRDDIPDPVITPQSGGTFVYNLQFSDVLNVCTANDSITIRVINPSELDCTQVFLPKAFTPNLDGLNDQFGISNPFAIQDLIAFEIFDRWGNRVFFTEDPFIKWDGNYLGVEVNPGIMLYRIQFRCNGEEKLKVGNFAIIK